MNKYQVIKQIVESKKINDDDKVYYVEMFVKGWYDETDLEWIWE